MRSDLFYSQSSSIPLPGVCRFLASFLVLSLLLLVPAAHAETPGFCARVLSSLESRIQKLIPHQEVYEIEQFKREFRLSDEAVAAIRDVRGHRFYNVKMFRVQSGEQSRLVLL